MDVSASAVCRRTPPPSPPPRGEVGRLKGVLASLFCVARRSARRAAARAFAASMAAVLPGSGGNWCGAGSTSADVSALVPEWRALPPPQPSPAALRCGGGGRSADISASAVCGRTPPPSPPPRGEGGRAAGDSATAGDAATDRLPPPVGEGWGGVNGCCTDVSWFNGCWARRAALRAAARALAASMAAILPLSGGSWCGAGSTLVDVSTLVPK